MKVLHLLAVLVFMACMGAVFDGVREWAVAGIAAVSFLVAVGALASAGRAAASTPAGGDSPSPVPPTIGTPPAGHHSSP